MPHSPWRQRRKDSHTGRPVSSSPSIAASSDGLSSDRVSSRIRSGGSGSSAKRRASSLIVSAASSESTSPLSEKATAHSPSRSSSCTAWRASRSPRRPTSIQCTGVSRSGHRRGPSVARAEARPQVLVEMTSQPACRYSRCTRSTASGFSISARVPHRRLVERLPGSGRLRQLGAEAAVEDHAALLGDRPRNAVIGARRPPCRVAGLLALDPLLRTCQGSEDTPRRGREALERLRSDHRQAEGAAHVEELLPGLDARCRRRAAAGSDRRSRAGAAPGRPRTSSRARRPTCRSGSSPASVEQLRRARPDEREGGRAVRAVGAVDGGAGDDRVAHDARPARRGAPRADHDRAVGRHAAAPAAGRADGRARRRGAAPSAPSRKWVSHGSEPAISSASRSERTARPTRLTHTASSVAAEPKLAATAWPSRTHHHAAGQSQAIGDGGPGNFSAGGGHGGHASPARRGFRLPMGRSCPPLREGRSERPICPPPCLGSCGRGAPAEHPACPDRVGARARAQARRELRARAGAGAPRAGRRGRRARVAGGRRAPRAGGLRGDRRARWRSCSRTCARARE